MASDSDDNSSSSSSENEDVVNIGIRRRLLDNIRVFENDPRPAGAVGNIEEGLAAGGVLAVREYRDRARLQEFIILGLPENLYLREGRQWCNCGNCILEEMWENRYCCQEVDKIVQKNKDEPHIGCITTHPWFGPAILNMATLQIAYWQYASQYEEPVVEGSVERRYRYTAYRQFVRWCWKFLGKDRRVPIASCVLNKIRDVFPDPGENYTGFKYPELDRA